MRTVLSVTPRNYKNLVAKDAISLGNLNILLGPNASGKSNLIQLLQFLSGYASEGQDARSSASSFTQSILSLGGDEILDQDISKPGIVNLVYEFPDSSGEASVFFEIELLVQGQNRKVIVNTEMLYQYRKIKPEPFYFYQAHNQRSGSGVVSVYDQPGLTKTHFQPIQDVPVDELILVALPRLLEGSNFPPDLTPVYPVRRKILDSLSTWQFYNANHMNLRAIRTATPNLGPGDIFLSPSGENLALVFENLSANLDFSEAVDDAMREILPWTRKVRALRSGFSVIIEWHFEPPGGKRNQFFLKDLSDGTVRMLCWAVILCSPELPDLLVIEEPEIGIHPAWMPMLARWIKKASQKTQVIISTHSPDLLDHFTDLAESVLVVKPVTPQAHRFAFFPLKLPVVAQRLAEGWQLGDLYRVGDPGVGGWPW